MEKVFIVEDDECTLKLYELILDRYGYKIIGIARNGQEALEIFKTLEDKPDLIIMDYFLPIKDRLTTIKELINLDRNLKIIMIFGEDSIKNKAYLPGALSFIKKPFTIKYFIKKISKVIKKK